MTLSVRLCEMTSGGVVYMNDWQVYDLLLWANVNDGIVKESEYTVELSVIVAAVILLTLLTVVEPSNQINSTLLVIPLTVVRLHCSVNGCLPIWLDGAVTWIVGAGTKEKK